MMSWKSRLRRLERADAARELLIDYVRAVDRNQLERLRDVFTADAVFASGAITTHGVGAIIQRLAASRVGITSSKHLLGTTASKVSSSRSIELDSYLVVVLVRPDRRSIGYGSYTARVEGEDGRLRISMLDLELDATIDGAN